jgi:hypothetical protein
MADKVELQANGSTARLGAFVLNRYGAPHLSELTACDAPEIDEPPNYLAALVLNSTFIMGYQEPLNRLVLMFGRRIEHAVREYRAARELLIAYLTKLPQTNNHFLQAMRATTHFEQCVGAVAQAIALLTCISKIVPPVIDEEEDRARRIRQIWNRSKHFDADIDDNLAPADITAPVWLTNRGISSTQANVSYQELHSTMTHLLSLLRVFADETPRRFVERRDAKRPEEKQP